ncbi:MAG: SRPBCC family protein [Chloroflexota bacterium]
MPQSPEAPPDERIVREIKIDAPPDVVYQYFVDPAKLARWKGSLATLDPRPGGIYRVVINQRNIARGTYLELVPNRRVVFSWGWDSGGHPVPPGSSTVELTLTPDGDGTLLRLVHSGLPADAVPGHAEGWDHYLPRLALAAGGGDPGRDPWAGDASA